MATPPPLTEIRVFMRWDAATGATIRRIGARPTVSSDDEMMSDIRTLAAGYARAGRSEFPVIIDSTADVPWREVVHVVDLCKVDGRAKIEFAAPMESGR